MGLGYRGLDRHSVLGAAAGDTTLRYRDKAGKVAIRGQAFGVGAFEDKDDDIYGTEDMSNYDFESAPEKHTSRPAPGSADRLARTLAGFRLSEGKRATRPRYPPPPLPPGFVPRHRARASRFEPRPEERRGLERHRLSAGRRAEMIGEQRPADPVGSSPAAARTETPTGAQSEAQPAAPVAAGLPGRPESERPSQPADSPAVKTEPGAVPADAERLRELHQLLAESGDSPAAAAPALKPFASDPEKQARYEKFLKLQAANRKEDYHLLLPASMTDWERQREVSEFHRSALIFRPLAASLADKFVSAGTSDQEKPPAPGEAGAGRKESSDPATQAARRRMFGFLTRQTQEWHPAPLLCRRFNVKNPYPHSSIVGTLGLASGAASMSAPVLPTPTPAADAPAAPKPRLRWDDVLSDEEGGGTDTAAGAGGATAPSVSLAGSLLALPAPNTAGPPPATTAPAQKPPPDLFKAIFDDSDTESESEDAPAKSADSPGTPPLVEGAQPTAVTGNQLAASAGEGAARPEPPRSPPVEPQGQRGKPSGPSSGRPTAASFFNQAPSAAAKRQGFSLFDNVDLDELNSWRRGGSGGGGNGESAADGTEDGQTAAPAASVPAPPVGSLSPGSDDEYGPRLPPGAPTAATTSSSSCLPVSCMGRKRKRSDSDADEWREMSPNGHKKKKSKKHKKSDKKKKKSKRRDSGSDSSDSDDVDRTLLKKLRDVVMKKKKKKKSSSRH